MTQPILISNSDTQSRTRPDTSTAMTQLIDQVRETIPFNTPAEKLCAGPCTGCPKKLMEYLDSELEDWEYKLDNDEQPNLGEVRKLGKTSQKIYTVLKKNNLIKGDDKKIP